jgi:hypothetical protein
VLRQEKKTVRLIAFEIEHVIFLSVLLRIGIDVELLSEDVMAQN